MSPLMFDFQKKTLKLVCGLRPKSSSFPDFGIPSHNMRSAHGQCVLFTPWPPCGASVELKAWLVGKLRRKQGGGGGGGVSGALIIKI